jgi:hypothetical protein
MGNGNYSTAAHEALLSGRANIPVQKIFQQSKCHPLMDPKGVRLRECRDIPRLLATRQLPIFMKILMECKVRDPQLLFLAVGDAVSDKAPLQVGQFESTAELMDQWLTWSYLEGGGGGTGQESYELGLYFLAMHTEMDCMVKRKKRGYLFLTGDEVPYPNLSKHVVEAVIGDRLEDDIPCEAIVAELQKTFTPFFVIPDLERAKTVERRWRDLFGDHVLCLENPDDVCYVAAGAILLSEGLVASLPELAQRLDQAGMPSDRKGAVIRALSPYAGVIFDPGHPA